MRPSSALPLLQLPALYLMHEHINYFTEESLVTLMKKGGGEVVASGSYLFAGAGGASQHRVVPWIPSHIQDAKRLVKPPLEPEW